MDHAQLIQGFSDQTEVADAHFLVSVVELTPFLSISVCWFWFRLSQTTIYTRVQVERVYKSNPIFEAKNTTFLEKV